MNNIVIVYFDNVIMKSRNSVDNNITFPIIFFYIQKCSI